MQSCCGSDEVTNRHCEVGEVARATRTCAAADVLREVGRATRSRGAADVVNDGVVARASVETSHRVVLAGEFTFDVAELQEVIALRLKFGVINIGTSGEVGAAVCGEVRQGSKCGGGLFPLDAHTISAIKGPSDELGHPQL